MHSKIPDVALAAACCLLFASAASMAQTYRWVDEQGVVNYGEKPPAGRPARLVDTQPGGTIESTDLRQKMLESDRQQRADARLAAMQPPAPAAAPVRGMDFETYIRLQRGMPEGELLLRAGRPDHEAVENFRHDVVKSYTYFPTVASPYITVVTVRGGRIAAVERIRKTF